MHIVNCIKTWLLWALMSLPLTCLAVAVVEYVVKHGCDIYAVTSLAVIIWIGAFAASVALDAFPDEEEESTANEP